MRHLVVFSALFLSAVAAQELSDDIVSQVRTRLEESAQRSWELGTRAQALLEHDARRYSVFSPNSIIPPDDIPSGNETGLQAVLSIAESIVANRSSENGNISGPQPLMQDGSAADPAANGVAVLLAAWTNQEGQDYSGAAQDQLDYLLLEVPKTDDGAISHRVSEVSLWSDYVYMVPPFLVYYGVMRGNMSMVDESINQIRLYRQYLRDTDADNLWMHIVEGEDFDDPGHWATGNGWAAAGILRVVSTIQNSQYSFQYESAVDELIGYVREIHDAMYDVVDDTHIFRNYADNGNSFYDAASTALLASTVYRMSLIAEDHSHVPDAERARRALVDPENNHFDDDGWLTPVVNPHSFGAEGEQSAEGQAFVLLMQAAWEDWVAAGSQGSGALAVKAGGLLAVSVAAAVGLVVLVL